MISWIIRHRAVVIVATLLITIFMGWRAALVKTDMDFINYLPPEDSDVQYFKEVQTRFGGNYIAMVLVSSGEESIFAKAALQKGFDLQKKFESLEGVRDVISIFNAIDIVKTEYGVEVGELMPTLPETLPQIQKIRSKIMHNDRFRGVLVSDDSKTMVYLIRFKDNVAKDMVAEDIADTALASYPEELLAFAGFPMLMLANAQMLPKDMMTLIPLVLLVIIMALFFGFRRLRGIVLPLLIVVVTTIWTIGLMEIVGVPLTMISSIIPVVLISVASAYAIHVLNRYFIVAADETDRADAVGNALGQIWLPVALASLTTFFGFLSLLTATLQPIRDFGLFTAVGTLVALLLSLTFLPALLACLKLPQQKKATEHQMELLRQKVAALGRWVGAHSRLLLGVSLAVFVASVLLIPGINREMNMIGFFPEDSAVRKADKIVKEKFGGSDSFVIDFAAEDVLHPVVQYLMMDTQKWLASREHIHNPQSIVDLFAEMYDVMNGVAGVPASRSEVGGLWMMLDGQSLLDQMITADRTETTLQAQLDVLISSKVARIHKDVRAKVAQISGAWHYARLGTLSGAEVAAFVAERQEWVQRWIAWDLRQHLGKKFPSGTMDKTLQLWSQARVPMSHFSAQMHSMLSKSFADNEIEINSGRMGSVVQRLNSLSYPLAGSAMVGMVELLLPQDLAEDGEEVGYIADSVAKQLNLLIRIRVAKKAVAALLQTLEISNPKVDLLDDLMQDAFLLTSPVLPSKNLPGNTIELRAREVGNPFIVTKMNEMLLTGQIQSIAIALVMVFVLLIIQLRSFVLGLLAIVPIANTVVILFGMMRLFGVDLDTSTAMIASITIGVGIDYTIHVISRFRSEVRHAASIAEAIPATLSQVGVAVILNAVSVGLGFFVLMGSEMLPMRNFGWLMLVGMVMSSLGALTLFPALLNVFQPKAVLKLLNNQSNNQPINQTKEAL